MKELDRKTNIMVYVVIIIFCLFLGTFLFLFFNKKTESNNVDNDELEEDVVEAVVKPFDSIETLNVTINDESYVLTLENNQTAYDLFNVVPLEVEMEDLNNNEKYKYLSFSLEYDNSYTGYIRKGDVMLYESNCLVIFYKDFETDYSYTRIGHIDNLSDFDDSNITVKIVK